MKIKLENFRNNILVFMRSCGYIFIERSPDDEWNFARSFSSGHYPRFHCYLKKEGSALMLNLHLDQKRPSYGGSSAHSGEYEGEIIDVEVQRIRQIFAGPR